MIQPASYTLEVTDVSGQRRHKARGVPADSTIGEFIDGLVPRLNLTTTSPAGDVVTYHALLQREGRHLHRSEIVRETVRPNDLLVIEPEIKAG